MLIIVTFYKIILYLIFFFLTSTATYAANTTIVKSYTLTDLESASFITIRTSSAPKYRISYTKDKKQVFVVFNAATSSIKANKTIASKLLKDLAFTSLPSKKLKLTLSFTSPIIVTRDVVIAPSKDHRDYLLRLTINSASTTQPIATNIPNKETPPIPTLKKRSAGTLPLITIDAGHGGHDPGSMGRSGKYEKLFTLEYAKSLRDALLATGRYRVFMTRTDDTYVDLHDRVKRSEEKKSDLFISIHADSHSNPSMMGLSVYTLSETASDQEAEALAQKANTSGNIGNVEISDASHEVTPLLIEMVQRDTKNFSSIFAEDLVAQLQQQIHLLRNTHRFAGFRVLMSASTPSVLIELGYLSNPKEELLLQSSEYKKKLVSSIVKAIDIYFTKNRF